MHYYQFNIGDYASHTRNLSLLEDLAYRRLLDAYYLAERPLSGSSTDVARLIGMRDHLDEVEYVLRTFFEQCDEGWRNKRADEEIAHFLSKKKQASDAGKASAQRRLNARSTSVEKSPTDVQPTNNQEPINNKPPISPKGVEERFERFWNAYPRKVGKDAAKRKFIQRKPDESMLERMVQAIAKQSMSEQWMRDGGQFIPHPSTWLSQGRWLDGDEPIVTNTLGVTFV